MIELTPRLKAIADLACTYGVPESMCDVGTDHGYIPVYMVQNGCGLAIATDISAPSAQKAYNNAVKYSLTDKIQVRTGDGLTSIADDEAKCVVIAGMGGLMITKILSNYIPEGVQHFVLQPMRSDYELRKFLCENGFVVDKEVLCEDDNRIYNIMLVSYGNGECDDFTMHYGNIEESDLYYKYIENEMKSLNKKISGIKRGGCEPDKDLVARYEVLSEVFERR